MSNQQLEPCPFCGADAFISWDGDTNSPNDWSAVCDNTLNCAASIGGMYSEDAARQAWNSRSRVSIGEVVATADYVGLAEWLNMLVSALQASEKFDYHEWGQFIMGAENWADRLRAMSLPAEPRDYCTGASCSDCNRSDCTCSHHAP